MATLWVSCMKTVLPPGTSGSSSSSGVCFINADCYVPELDVFANGMLAEQGPYPYGSGSSGYITYPSGKYTFAMNAAGSQSSIVSQSAMITADEVYTLVLYDSTVSRSLLMFIRDNPQNTSRVSANVRFLDLCPDLGGEMDVYLGNTQWFSGRKFQDNLEDPALDTFMQVGAGSYVLDVKFRSAQQSDSILKKISLNAGNIYTFFASGFAGAHDSTALRIGMVENF
ncbi:MAG TPA: DUF4397 domain-containing protein [Chitinophagaceae bacterium]|nr:DUF4397 domain-containing protein [Chitinophagaceae bacterium]